MIWGMVCSFRSEEFVEHCVVKFWRVLFLLTAVVGRSNAIGTTIKSFLQVELEESRCDRAAPTLPLAFFNSSNQALYK